MLYVIQVLLTACEQDQDGTGSVLILLASCQQNLYDIYHCCVCSEKVLIMDRGTVQTCRVLFQNKFGKLVHPVGIFITNFTLLNILLCF